MIRKECYYHIHRKGNMDQFWYKGNVLDIDENFNSILYLNILKEQEILFKRYGFQKLDSVIGTLEYMKKNDKFPKHLVNEFNILLKNYYFLRRELALEEGRIIFNHNAPSRFHSIFVTDDNSLYYYARQFGRQDYDIFMVDLDGKIFTSYVDFFPGEKLCYSDQVEESQDYWKPKMNGKHKEILFQGKLRIK